MVFKKIFRAILYAIEVFFGLFVLYILYVFLGMLIPVNWSYEYSQEEIQFFVISNGVHTDICLPVRNEVFDWTKYIHTKDFADVPVAPAYIGIGWGDKGFYLDTPTWAELKTSTAFKAIFLPSETAMHITYYQVAPPASERVIRCSMDNEEYKRLIAYIKASFETNGQLVDVQLIPGKGYTLNDNFYEATGNYWGLKTCNTWTNDALKVAGVKTSFHALFEAGIMRWFH